MAKSQDVINLLGVRTKPGRNVSGPVQPQNNKRPKISAKDQKGYGSDQKNAPKTPSKNSSVGTIMRHFADGATNKY